MFTVEVEKEEDGRWIAEVVDLPGVMVYADTSEEAVTKVRAALVDALWHEIRRAVIHDQYFA